MNTRKLVLLYGKDIQLLDTRAWVLRRARLDVHHFQDALSAALLLRERDPDLLILCHTLSAEEQKSARVVARAAKSMIKILMMTAEAPAPTEDDSVVYLNALAGPLALVDKVNQLLDLSSPA